MPSQCDDLARLKKTALLRFFSGALIIGSVLFVSAGTLRYWQGWLYLAVIFMPMSMFLRFLIRKDPALLERRMRTLERESVQKAVVFGSVPFFLALFLVPSLDYRFGWSAVPAWLILVAALAVLAGYGLFVLVLLENRFAARVVVIEENQKLITTGPYTFVRHPMYSSIVLIIIATPLALGSFWGLLAIPALIAALIARILNEEKVLVQGLAGYNDYQRRVCWRLIPGVW